MIKLTMALLTATLFTSAILHGQTDSLRNQISISGGYPLPASMTTFKTDFVGNFCGNFNYERLVSKHFIAGGSSSYSLFGTNTHLDSKMNVITVSGNAGYRLQFLNKMECIFALNAGYSEILFRSKDFKSPENKFNEGGVSAAPVLIINYHLSKKIEAGVNTSYTVIFNHFGDPDVSEDSTIRFFNIGLEFIYRY